MLSVVWYYALYQIVLRIERIYYRPNWDKDTSGIGWLRNSSRIVSYTDRIKYDNLAKAWFFTTPAWVRDHKTAYRLIWCWRIGEVLLIFSALCVLFGPSLIGLLW
jgi:hypothetical protein